MPEFRRVRLTLRSLCVIALGFCCLLSLAACSGGASAPPGDDGGQKGRSGLEGKYVYQLDKSTGQSMTIELMPDGIAKVTRPDGRVEDGIYNRVDSGKVIVNTKGSGSRYTVDGDGNLSTIFYGKDTAVFVKQ